LTRDIVDGLDAQMSVAGAYRRLAPFLGEFACTIDLVNETFSGNRMTDGDWLAVRVADTGARWSSNDPRVNDTLRWYSASSTLVAAPIFMLSTEGRAPDPHLDQLECILRDDGYLGAVRSHRVEHDARPFAAGLIVAYGSVIHALAAVSGAAHRALWAIVTDSVASHALAAGRTLGKTDETCTLAVELAVPLLPTPKFVDTGSSSRTDQFIRLASCCLIHITAGNDKCTSCPRRDPTDRHARLLRRIDDRDEVSGPIPAGPQEPRSPETSCSSYPRDGAGYYRRERYTGPCSPLGSDASPLPPIKVTFSRT